ncbi:MAG: TonB-dependent receptor, partial [Proteobacteria bacterium]|nr:TonB-dependent receptor [Pseudomonadota bacterium]
MRTTLIYSSSGYALRKARALIWAFLLLLGAPPQALAADAEEGEIEEVVVTGSFIARKLNQQAQPVDIFDRSTFEQLGSPQTVEIIQNTPSISGTLNQSEQYQGTGVATGLKNINMRGLRADRTLVMLNNKRIVNAGASVSKEQVFVPDVGNFPQIAMQRIEILKNGGAVTYGTDAIAGVWNFITRDEFEGFEINAMHQDIQDSDGDQSLGVIWGTTNGDAHWVNSFEFERRGVLSIPDRNLATYNSTELDDPNYWPLGRSSFGNPGTFNNFDPSAGANPSLVDPGCGEQYRDGSSVRGMHNGVSGCGYSYMPFANIIDEQDRFKVFSQVKLTINDRHEVYGDLLWSRMESVYEGSPSYPPTNPDAGNFTWVPTPNPGFNAILEDIEASGDPDAVAATFRTAGGASWFGRSLAGEGPAARFPRKHETLRIVGGSRGDITDLISYDVSLNWSTTSADLDGLDVLTERWSHAASGWGGVQCNRPDTGSPEYDVGPTAEQLAQGCSYIFPVSMAIGAEAGDAFYNDPELRDWFTGESSGITQNRLMVVDAVFNGGTNFDLNGGEILWAAGAQYRWYESEFSPTGDNRVDGPDVANPFHFLTTSVSSSLVNKQYAIFAEGIFPVTETLDIEAGLRLEDYDVDRVVKPKLAARWDAAEWLAFRFSYEGVFRTPILPTQVGTSLELFGPVGEYLQISTPIPDSLDPEESDNFNVGVIFNTEQLTATLDYYSIDLSGPFSRETATCDCATKVTRSGTAYDPDAEAGTPGSPQDVSYIETELINGDGIETDGIDLEVSYSIPSDLGVWDIGINLNYILNFDVAGELNPETGEQTGRAYEAVGLYNVRAAALPIEIRSMPQYKTNAWLGWARDSHFARLYIRHIDSMKIPESFSEASKFPNLKEVDAQTTLDAHYNYSFLEDSMSVGLSVINLTDETP